MKKNLFRVALFAVALCGFTACEEEDKEELEQKIEGITNPDGDGQESGGDGQESGASVTVGAYILNTGNWKENNASIQYLDKETGLLSEDLYAAANGGKSLGDLGQDLCLYGSKLYVTVSNSNKVVVMDKDCKVLKKIDTTNEAGLPISPRYMTAAGGNVYFTAYDGTVSRLDTASLDITGKVAVGDYPEAITNTKGKLFVNISGYGKENKVAVVDIATFTKERDIEVLLNPYTQCKVGADGFVYVVSNGNYAGKPNMDPADYIYGTMQRIDPATYEVTPVCNATYFANSGDKMYILYSEYYLQERNRAYVYDLKTGESSDFLDISTLSSPNSIDIDPVNGDVYVTNAPYNATSDVYVYTKDGEQKAKFSAGYSTSKVLFVTK